MAEMLLLVAVDDRGRLSRQPIIDSIMGGALLTELAVHGQLTLGKGRTLRVAGTRPGDELLADVYDAVRDHMHRLSVRGVITGVSGHIGGSCNRVAGRLAGDGVLGRERTWVLGPTRYPVLDAAARQAVLAQVWAATAGAAPPGSDAAVVVELAVKSGVQMQVPDGRTHSEHLKLLLHRPETHFSPDVAPVVKELFRQMDVIGSASIRVRGL